MKILYALPVLLLGLLSAGSYYKIQTDKIVETAATSSGESEVVCGDAQSIMRVVNQFGEVPFFHAVKGSTDPVKNARGVVTLLTLNAKTGTWSQFEIEPDGQACLIGQGVLGEMMFGSFGDIT